MILQKILANKKLEVARRQSTTSLKALQSLLPGLPAPRPLGPALRRPGEVAVIAEVKKASPSKGVLRQDLDPGQTALEYQRYGAAAVSVLTEEKFFLGHPSYLVVIKDEISLPVLRKDFIIDPYQIYESRVLGADAVLLIAAALPGGQLAELIELAAGLGLSCLVEVHTEEELDRVLAAGADLIGINNRDLHTFETDLARTFSLAGRLKNQDVTIVSESGIKDRSDILRLKEIGVHAVLVGEALVRHPSPGLALRALLGCRPGPEEGGMPFAGLHQGQG